jgi:hypothetical protein
MISLLPQTLLLPLWMWKRSSKVVAKSPKVFSGSSIILSKNSSFQPMFHDFDSLACHHLAMTAIGLVIRRL